MTPLNIPVNEQHNPDSVSIAAEAERCEPWMPGLQLVHSGQSESSEPAQCVAGEPGAGVGTDNCDGESMAWNPRLTSLSYALARLNSIETQDRLKRAV
jgi:hypothetical protein